jgi:hypothetical protein
MEVKSIGEILDELQPGYPLQVKEKGDISAFQIFEGGASLSTGYNIKIH